MGICVLAPGQRGGSGQQAWATGVRSCNNLHELAQHSSGLWEIAWQGEPWLCLQPLPGSRSPLPSHALSRGAQASPGAVRPAWTSTQELWPSSRQ